jgi:DNA primase
MSTGNEYRTYVEKVRAAHALEDLFARYGHPVHNRQALCFFHADSRPSCSVSNELYNCFACHTSGDLFALVMGLDGLTFPQAVDQLATWADIAIYRPTPKDRQQVLDDRVLENATETAASYYQAKLTPEVRDYLVDGRKLTPTVVEQARLGWADGNLVTSLGSALGLEVLVQAGLARLGKNASTWSGPGAQDLLHRRIVFPALVRGQARFLVGRAFDKDQEPKYVNQKRPNAPLYNADVVGPATLFVTEGPVDALSLAGWGLPAVALLGTMHASLVAQLRRPKMLYCCLDADVAGRSGVYRLWAALGPSKMRVVTLPEGQDPNDFARTHTVGQFMTLVAEAVDPITFVLRQIDVTQIEPGTLGPRLERLFKVFLGMSQPDVAACLEYQVTAWAQGRKALVKAIRRAWQDYAESQLTCPACGTVLVRHATL